jgi:hypothetical protein
VARQFTLGHLPRLVVEHDGWNLEFEALPMSSAAVGQKRRLVGMFGPAKAQVVDNVNGLRRALYSKANRYGDLDVPLVIAVLANTEFTTEDYELEKALFGLSAWRPAQTAEDAKTRLFEGGHWLDTSGWRRGHAPQVIAAQGLQPWNITEVHPRLWSTFELRTVHPWQPGWLSRVSVDSPELVVTEGESLHALFGLAPDWPPGPPFA